MVTPLFASFDALATAVVLFDTNMNVVHANPAAENLFEFSCKNVVGHHFSEIFQDSAALAEAIGYAQRHGSTFTEHDLVLGTSNHGRMHLNCTLTPVDFAGSSWLAEFRPLDQSLKLAREERMLDQTQANRELLRNLAHEIRNPLGGIRGAAQLLERELEKPGLSEYTQVIMKEADRLQSLMDRLLVPHRLPRPVSVNIHEVLERVRSLILAENPEGLRIRQDYDPSIPSLLADKEQLIQAFLNIARNAAQALEGQGLITLRTRVLRQVTLARKRYRHALMIEVQDNGPGIPENIRDKIFYPLVTGRAEGSGLGLTLAQDFIAQHHGTIECESAPGNTRFISILPLTSNEA